MKRLPEFLRSRLRDIAEKRLRLGVPCPYMVFDPNGYHSCAILTELSRMEHPDWEPADVMCVWYHAVCYDIGEWREEDIPKICPRGHTYEEIDAKIQLLLEKVDWGNRPIDRKTRQKYDEEASE